MWINNKCELYWFFDIFIIYMLIIYFLFLNFNKGGFGSLVFLCLLKISDLKNIGERYLFK